MNGQTSLCVREILSASGSRELAASVGRLYRHVDRAVAGSGFQCSNKGLCCDFGQYGHKLFVTTVELAYFVRGQGAQPPNAPAGRCPYHQEGVCVARRHRPIGCRLFFCQPGSAVWQEQQYQALRSRIIALHERLGLPYMYVEWLGGLVQLAEKAGLLAEPGALTRKAGCG